MGHSDRCRWNDRRCSLPNDRHDDPVVWVGPKDGGWIKVVDLPDIDPLAPRPCPPYEVQRDRATIFVAIASFRDSLCAHTLHGLFHRAKYPSRIRVAVVQQIAEADGDCLEGYCELDPECRRSQVATKTFHSSQAKGPTWARAQDFDMLPQDAEFCLRTDSHMAFSNDWDVKQIEQWYAAENEFAILSTYVADATQIRRNGTEVNVNNKWEVPHLCSILWQDGHVRNMQAKAARNLRKPKLTTLWAAGLSFARCHAERAVPYDPHTPYIFWGEEFSRTARFFTRGYDVYTPPRTVIAHDYKGTQGDPHHFKWNGKGGPRIRTNETIRNIRDASNRRIWSLLDMPGGDSNADLGPVFGLGTVRTLDQLIQFTGIQLRNRTIFANRCGNIDWVEWDCIAHRNHFRKNSAFLLRQATDGNLRHSDDDPINDIATIRHLQQGIEQSHLRDIITQHRSAVPQTPPPFSPTLSGILLSCACFGYIVFIRRRRKRAKLVGTSYYPTKVV